MPIVSRLTMLLNPSYLRTRVFNKIRDFFIKLFDVKPKDKNDYYTVGGWMISKKLAFAIVIIVGTISIVYLVFIRSAFGAGSGDNIRTYKYNSLILRMQKGEVRIKAKDGHVAYEGQVQKGYAQGKGNLFNKAGTLIYEGNFTKSKFEGNGVSYFPTGTVHYNGKFHSNLYSGKGSLYRENGNLEYEGEFLDGKKEGEGIYYDKAGNSVYSGTFAADDILYSKLVGLETTDVAKAYTGKRTVYQTDQSLVVYMSDINALYEIPNDAENLEDSSVVSSIYVISDYIMVGGKKATNVTALSVAMGSPIHQGDSVATVAESIGINILSQKKSVYSGPVNMERTKKKDDLYDVTGYSTDYKVYLYSFESGGLIYSFLTEDEAGSSFDMYFITADDLGDGDEKEASE